MLNELEDEFELFCEANELEESLATQYMYLLSKVIKEELGNDE